MKLGALSLLCSRGIRTPCVVMLPTLLAWCLQASVYLRLCAKVLIFFFPPSFLFLSSHFFSAQRSFLSSSAQILVEGKKGQTMGTLFLLLLSTSTFPLLAPHSSHPPIYSLNHNMIHASVIIRLTLHHSMQANGTWESLHFSGFRLG